MNCTQKIVLEHEQQILNLIHGYYFLIVYIFILKVYYEGRLRNNNKLFDATNKGPGFKFRLGRGEVIKAWDVGVSGMKVGGKRRIVCPPNTA